MLCNECNAKSATMHYVTIINGVKNEVDLCADCAAKLGASSYSPFTWGDLFAHPSAPAPRAICSKCGMTLSELKSKGVVGCENCYVDLRAGIEPVLRRVQKSLNHVGRSPVGGIANKLPRPGETQTSPREPSELEKLQTELQAAIASEKFELAAQIRDKIKGLKSVDNNQGASEQKPKSSSGEEKQDGAKNVQNGGAN